MSTAPAIPRSTPSDFIGVIFSPMVRAAQSIPATGVSVAMSFDGENSYDILPATFDGVAYSVRYSVGKITIYGEDPLKNKLEVEKLLNDIWKEGMKITVYTNGNLPILNPLSYHYRISLYIVKVQESEMNIQMLRNLCLYSTDYLLCFQDDPVNLEERSNALLKNILDTDEEFFATMLKKHSPSSHIVYIPKNKDDIKEVKNICFKTGRYFNTFI